ncbi:hypothetical protein [Streptomyces sp. DH24]|uniref:hypothetical protein n=1 Tax=Streptomyces sp. DH24 TaxID=3040123 RepID=UPI0024431818|nr:hypothetical protein [Streptomyces sp. DH24]MDG9721087.1 hypothetical protein [Streptomyces sp. DH24]
MPLHGQNGRLKKGNAAWTVRHYQSITREEYAHADYDFAVTCANAAAGLHLTRPVRRQTSA